MFYVVFCGVNSFGVKTLRKHAKIESLFLPHRCHVFTAFLLENRTFYNFHFQTFVEFLPQILLLSFISISEWITSKEDHLDFHRGAWIPLLTDHAAETPMKRMFVPYHLLKLRYQPKLYFECSQNREFHSWWRCPSLIATSCWSNV